MTGFSTRRWRWLKLPVILSAVAALTACEAGGSGSAAQGSGGASITRGEQDVERPDLFDVTDRGLWDGRPSLGGIWVAHPDVREPERVVIRNTANGQSTIGALFRRERANPGPTLQLSSDAAEALGILAGAPTELNVVALRRQEVEVAAEPTNDLADGETLPAPAEIASTPLDPVAAIPVATTPLEPAAAPLANVDQQPATADPVAVSSPPATATGLPPEPLVQVGVFSVQPNADSAAATLRSAGFTANVIPLQSAGRQTWRVVAGPVPDPATLARVKALGFADAYVLQNP